MRSLRVAGRAAAGNSGVRGADFADHFHDDVVQLFVVGDIGQQCFVSDFRGVPINAMHFGIEEAILMVRHASSKTCLRSATVSISMRTVNITRRGAAGALRLLPRLELRLHFLHRVRHDHRPRLLRLQPAHFHLRAAAAMPTE